MSTFIETRNVCARRTSARAALRLAASSLSPSLPRRTHSSATLANPTYPLRFPVWRSRVLHCSQVHAPTPLPVSAPASSLQQALPLPPLVHPWYTKELKEATVAKRQFAEERCDERARCSRTAARGPIIPHAPVRSFLFIFTFFYSYKSFLLSSCIGVIGSIVIIITQSRFFVAGAQRMQSSIAE